MSCPFTLDKGLMLVGSREALIRPRKEQHQRLGRAIFCTTHHLRTIPPEPSLTSLQLFGSEVTPVFP
jgi:hypothetical protein